MPMYQLVESVIGYRCQVVRNVWIVLLSAEESNGHYCYTIVSDRDGAIDRKLYPLVRVNLVAIANNQSPESVQVSV